MATKASILKALDGSSINLTTAAIEAAIQAVRDGEITTKADGRRWWRDSGSSHGLHMVASRNSAAFYRISRRPGKRSKVYQRIGDATSMKLTTARERSLKLAAGDESAAAPVRVRTDGITASAAFDQYMADSASGDFKVGRKQPGANTLKSYRQLFDPHVRPKYGNRSLHHLAANAQAILDALSDKPVTAGRLCQVLRNLFTWAAVKGHWEKANPMIDPVRGRPIASQSVPSRARHLTTTEARRLVQHLESEPAHWRHFFTLLILLGCRCGNLRHMKWAELDVEGRVWLVPTSKTGEPLTVPLTDSAIAIIEERRAARVESAYVFPQRYNRGKPIADVEHAWRRIRQVAGIPDLRIHDLRRTAGSWATQSGVPLAGVGQLLGHRSSNSTAIYARSDVRLAMRAAAAVEDRLFGGSDDGEDEGSQEGSQEGRGRAAKKKLSSRRVQAKSRRNQAGD